MRKYLVAALVLTLAYTAYGIELKRVMAMKPRSTVTAISPKTHVFGLQSTAQGWEAILVSEESVLKLGGVDTSSPEGQRYSFPYNGSTPFVGTPERGMMQTTMTGPQWFDGEGWVPVGVAYNDASLWANFANYLLKSEHDASVAVAQARFDNFSTQISQLKSAVVAGGGTLTGAAAATLAPLVFGDVVAGQTKTLTAQIDNTGLGNLVLGTAAKSGTGAAKYTLDGGCSGQTVAPGASCLESITFTPGTAGTYTAQVSFPHNATGSPTLLDVSGTGLAAQACSVTPYANIASAATTATAVGQNAYNTYNGIRIDAGQADRTICKVGFYVASVTGDVSSIAWRVEVWSTNSTTGALGTLKRYSATTTGVTEGSNPVLSLTSPVITSATDVVLVTREDHGANATNYINLASSGTSSETYSHAIRYQSGGTIGQETAGSEKRFQLYEVQ